MHGGKMLTLHRGDAGRTSSWRTGSRGGARGAGSTSCRRRRGALGEARGDGGDGREGRGPVASDVRFSRRDAREWSGMGHTQVCVHLSRLESLEYVVMHRAARGQGVAYELVVTRARARAEVSPSVATGTCRGAAPVGRRAGPSRARNRPPSGCAAPVLSSEKARASSRVVGRETATHVEGVAHGAPRRTRRGGRRRRGAVARPDRGRSGAGDVWAHAAAYCAWLEERHYSPRTVRTGARLPRRTSRPGRRARASCGPSEVTLPIVERYQRHLFHHRKANGKPLSWVRQAGRLGAVKGLFRYSRASTSSCRIRPPTS